MNIEKAKRGRKGEKPRFSSFGHLPVFRAGATLSERDPRKAGVRFGNPGEEHAGKTPSPPRPGRRRRARGMTSSCASSKRDDIFNSLVAGWNDLKAAPKYGLTIGALHTLGGWVAIFFAKLSGLNYFTYPFLTGIALIAPFSAAVLYEVSRRLETGEPLSWGGGAARGEDQRRPRSRLDVPRLAVLLHPVDRLFVFPLSDVLRRAHAGPGFVHSRRPCPRRRGWSSFWSEISSAE